MASFGQLSTDRPRRPSHDKRVSATEYPFLARLDVRKAVRLQVGDRLWPGAIGDDGPLASTAGMPFHFALKLRKSDVRLTERTLFQHCSRCTSRKSLE